MEVPAYSPKLNMFHWQNIVSRNSTTSRYRVSYKINPFCTLHSRYIHVMNKWRGWLRWVFGHLFCVPDTDGIKQKNKKPWNRTKKISPEQKKKKSFWSCQHKNQRDGLLSCSHPLPALFHRVHHSLPQAHHGSDKTPTSPPTFHPQHQVARSYPSRRGTALCSHCQCWSPNNRVTTSLGRTYVGWPIAGCQELCSTRNYAKVKGAMEDKNCVSKMSWSGIRRKQASRMIPGRRRQSRKSNGQDCWGRPR